MHTHLEHNRSSKIGRRLIDYDELVAKGIKFSKVHLWRMARSGTFPASVKLSHSRIAWVEAEIDEWLDDLLAARDTEARHD